MGFDLDAQRSGTITGFGMIEGGYIDFSAGTGTLDVPTRMTKAVMGFGIAQTVDPDNFYGLVASTDGDISAGAITFKRHGDYNSDLRVHYMMLGW